MIFRRKRHSDGRDHVLSRAEERLQVFEVDLERQVVDAVGFESDERRLVGCGLDSEWGNPGQRACVNSVLVG